MQVTRKDELADYFAYLRDNAEEAQALLADLLISVTTFFRDPRPSKRWRQASIPQLFDGKEAGDPIRVWVPGCATGEEAYSIAMLLLEEAGAPRSPAGDPGVRLRPRRRRARRSRARAAIPPPSRPMSARSGCGASSPREGDHYRVKRELRDIVLFASHSLLRDPPFSRLDLISCRNLLIYLDRELQQQVCSTFHYAPQSGRLSVPRLVGDRRPSRTACSGGRPRGAHLSIDRPAGDRLPALPRLLGPSAAASRPVAPSRAQSGAPAARDAALHREALEQIAPPSMLVDEHHRVAASVGTCRPLSAALRRAADHRHRRPGAPGAALRTALGAAPRLRARRADAQRCRSGAASTARRIAVYLQVKPVAGGRRRSGRAAPSSSSSRARRDRAGDARAIEPTRAAADETIRRLREELQLDPGRLRTTREESEAANEELRAANEELQSINEEYRSTAEELETSKEELQSINEELQTVNTELKLKLEAVSRANSDLQNLMAATDFGTLFLDPSLRIKRFTPRAHRAVQHHAERRGPADHRFHPSARL